MDPLDQAQAAFDLLVTGPNPLAVDGRRIGHGLPPRAIRLDELKSMLLHPSVGRAARDAAWAQLVIRTRSAPARFTPAPSTSASGPGLSRSAPSRSAWVVGAVGVAMPGLRRAAGRLCRGGEARWAADVEGEMLAGFLLALQTIDVAKPGIAGRLCWAAYRAGHRLVVATGRAGVLSADGVLAGQAVLPVPEDLIGAGLYGRLGNPAGGQNGGHDGGREEARALLARAVAEGLISRPAAHLIARTRLDGAALTAVAAELGTSYAAARERRRRAEKRLAAAFGNAGLGRRR
ncbi:MAG: hypothetical protein ACJ73S_03520 [Mycobacteriales bacterium]